MTTPNPAMIREIQSRLQQAWTVSVAGITVECVGPDGERVSINCGTVEDATALLAAAKA